MRRRLRFLKRLPLVLLLLAILLGVSPASALTAGGRYELTLASLTGPDTFSLSLWTVRAVANKVGDLLGSTPWARLSREESQRAFDDFFATADDANRLEYEIRDLANRGLTSNDPQMAELERQLRDVRQKRAEQSGLVERTIEEQVQTVLQAEDLSLLQAGGVFFPPVLFDLIDLPQMLIVARRNRIEMRSQVSIRRNVTTQETSRLESAVDQALDVRSLLVPIGGLGTYPTMVGSSGPLEWMVDVVSHEWCHVYLTFRPLGLSYGTNGEVTAINETVCSILGGDAAALVLEAYYGAERRERPWQTPPTPTSTEPPKREEPQGFNINRELRKIYLAAEQRLKEHDIAGAEQIMEEGRLFLAANGHYERKLNQAFFAFYGSYAEGPDSIRPDPIGEDLRELRRRSASLRDYMVTVSQMTSYDDLKRALGK